MSAAIVWFRNDLRLHDHEPLYRALKNHDLIIPFYCFEDKFFDKSVFGFQKTGNFRAQFLIESVENLRDNLIDLGSDLIVRKGNVADEIKALKEDIDASHIYCYKDIHQEEIDSQLTVENIVGIKLNYSFGCTLYHINDLPFHFKDTPNVFTQFRKEVEKNAEVRVQFNKPSQLPKLPSKIKRGSMPDLVQLGLAEIIPDRRAVIKVKGGESEAVKRLDSYSFKSEELSNYKQKRNGLLGSNYSSKLSLWLWNGCISPRKIFDVVKQYEREVKKNQSTYWLIFELIWRDYFKFIALKYGNRIFHETGVKGIAYSSEWNEEKFWCWANGKTGVPFIDANMRELNKTGYMSNRGRQNVASFFVKELNLDWRMGAAYFEDKLIDYDVASNYGNWMYIAGVGNDPRDRYFNIILQAKRYDPQGNFVKQWLPELAPLGSESIHHPWTRKLNLFGGKDVSYPDPIVKPEYWAKHY